MMKKLTFLLFSLLLVSCASSEIPIIEKEKKPISVILENDNKSYKCDNYIHKIRKGEDVSFVVSLKEGEWIDSCSYEKYAISSLGGNKYKLDLKDVEYSTYVKLVIAFEGLAYQGNGGITNNGDDVIKYTRSNYHLRENATNNMDAFTRVGYVATGFNTKSDGLGVHVGFGSRIPYEIDELYCEWEKETSLDLFDYSISENGIILKSYHGENKNVVIPLSKGNVVLADNLFSGKELDTLVLSNNVEYIGSHTFDGAKINELFVADNNINIPGKSLDKCGIKKVHINASVNPSYSGTYFDAFQDKMDYLIKNKDEKKFILFGGSSVRYGYDSKMIVKEFPSYKAVNMGVYAYVNALPQLELITQFMTKDDILLHSPEFDNPAVQDQFFTTKSFEFDEFALFESNYELLSMIDISKYEDFFSSFQEFLSSRVDMEKRNYSICAKNYDDEGNYSKIAVYNKYGDMSLYRPGHMIPDERICQDWCDYTLDNITPYAIESLNKVYDDLSSKGINSLFTYYPKNRYCLSEASTQEKRNELEEYIKANLHVPVISKMEDYLYDANYFYLIDNHLSTEGAEIRTKSVITDLKAYGIK